MFQLTKEEYDSLKCQFGTSNMRGGDRRALPYAFTQQGVAMLSGILRSKIAIDTNIKIMRAFVSLQRYAAASIQLFQRLERVETQQLENKHNAQYPEIKFIQLSYRNHDRFQIIDDKVYLLGASLKDIGAGLCAVTEMTISPEIILGLLK